jgi:DMSO/TMAO reductase YedYZ molybdopterin-dependent catalytic subunit
MTVIARGFSGRPHRDTPTLPPGQYLVDDFPVLAAGPTPRIDRADWQLTVTSEAGDEHRWSWEQFRELPREEVTTDIHCVTRWSKLHTNWEGVAIDALLADVETAADYALVSCYGGYTTNVPLEDLLDGQAWIVDRYDGDELDAEHGGPARLLVPHLYLWKSAKWVRSIELLDDDEPGFWETRGYHNYGDPWREQRYWDD